MKNLKMNIVSVLRNLIVKDDFDNLREKIEL